jgi:hypothetical protein
MRQFYGFEYASGVNTTMEYILNGRSKLRTAGFIEIFDTKAARDEWVSNGVRTADMSGERNRVAITRGEARKLDPRFVSGMPLC